MWQKHPASGPGNKTGAFAPAIGVADHRALARHAAMLIARTRQDLQQAVRALRAERPHLSLVPTMGALHGGHIALIGHAAAVVKDAGGGSVIASIFVNPLQFGAAEDLARYPRDEAGDLEKLQNAGCHAVWLPTPHEMYPPDDSTIIEPAGPALGWEADARPGHFRGVATVVAKLFGQIRPDFACFGEKDWQQLQVVRRMQTDLSLGVTVLGVPTLRETDGLAMSSRNRFLAPAERAAAPLLYAVLCRAAAALAGGDDAATTLRTQADTLRRAGFDVDYLALVDGESLRPVARPGAGARLIAAARLGSVRLLDNIAAG
jgi:pantoate--beta-alanine ligase